MDPSHFDTITRSFTTFASRRAALVGLIAGLFAPSVSDRDAEAKRRQRRERDKHSGSDAQRERLFMCSSATQNFCVNTKTNNHHCGVCWNECTNGTSCFNGICQFS